MPSLIRHINLGRLSLVPNGLVRSFVAVDLERPDLIARLEEIQRKIVSSGADLRPVQRENMHITMRFLGDISPSMVELTVEALKRVKFEPFSASLRGVGVFPKITYPRIIWVGIGKGKKNLEEIYRQLTRELEQLGFRPEHGDYTPHITLFRVRSGKARASLIESLTPMRETEFGEFDVRAIQLKRSVLTSNGPVYSTLGENRR